jgi:CBS domain-containing protein
MVLRARDVMTSRVVSVRPDTTLDRARYLLTENRFSALPVTDERHRLVGIVSTYDLLRADASPRSPATVSELMTPEPLSMAPDATVRIIAHRLRHYGELRLMPIVEGGRGGMLVGVVSRADLLTPEPRGGRIGRFRHRLQRGERVRPRSWGDGPARTGRTAADIMTPVDEVFDLTEETTAATAAAVMRERRVTAMPVLDTDGHVLGILSEADLVPDTLSGRRTPPPQTVGEAMTREVTCVLDTCSVPDLAHSLAGNRRRVLPVVDASGRMVGVVSRGDVLRATTPARDAP